MKAFGVKHSGAAFCSSFRAEARLVASQAEVRRRLDGIAALRQASRGTRMRYLVGDGRTQTLELDSTSISFTFFFDEINSKVRAAALMKFLAIIGVLGGLYEVSLDSIYSYVIDVLRESVGFENGGPPAAASEARLGEFVKALSAANESLSKSVVARISQKGADDRLLGEYGDFVNSIIEKLSRRGNDVRAVLVNDLGVKDDVAGKMLNRWSKNKRGDRFAVRV